jgi:AP-2 complex subunit mu-1
MAATSTSPVCFSALYFMNMRGDVLLERTYRDDVTRTMATAFKTEIINGREHHSRNSTSTGLQTPVVNLGACTFMYKRVQNVYIVAVTRANANVVMAFSFIDALVELLKQYFGKVTEHSLKQNFVVVYELLDEILDFGFPQITSAAVLQSFITQKAVRQSLGGKNGETSSYHAAAKAKEVSMQVTGAVQWRSPGLVYKKNEVYLDIVESISVLISPSGSVLRSSATGVIQMKCFLSGMPELTIGLNDRLGMESGGAGGGAGGAGGNDDHGKNHGGGRVKKQIDLADLQFHQCVNLSKFDSEKVISFTPPDGEFDLMKFRVTDTVSLPFKVMPLVRELGRTRLSVDVKIKSTFSEKQFANGVVLKIPVPKHTARASVKVTGGKSKYVAKEHALIWKIKQFQGMTELQLSADVELISTMSEKKPWSKPPVSLNFQVPMFTASGLRVRFLKVWEKTGYISTKWVRYLCNSGADAKAGSYEIRCA